MSWPNRNFAQSGGVSGTLALPVSSTAPASTMPCMATSVPSVMMSEGTDVRTFKMPFTNPTTTPTASAPSMPTQIGNP